MNLKLYTNNSPKNYLTKDLSAVTELTNVVLKEETSFIDPVFIVSTATISDLAASNYIECAAFSRFYFITNIKSIRNGVFEISAHVDVLSTYANEIRQQTAIIHRQENDWNLYLDDGIFKTYQNPHIVTKLFPSGFTTQNFVLAVAGS